MWFPCSRWSRSGSRDGRGRTLAGRQLGKQISGHGSHLWVKASPVDPHPVQDHRQLAGQRNARFPEARPPADGGSPEYRDRQHIRQGATHTIRRKGGVRSSLSVACAVAGRPRFTRLPMSSALWPDANGRQRQRRESGPRASRTCWPTRAMMPTGWVRDAGAVPVIPGRRNCKRTIRDEEERYRSHPL